MKLRKLINIIVLAVFAGCARGYPDDSEKLTGASVEFAKKLKAGWNLGNTLDAYLNYEEKGFTLDAETCWDMPKTTKRMIQTVHEAGFTTIRIPVSWHGHLSNDSDDPYRIKKDWMARVKEVVDYAYNEGMYVILNVHHDNLSVYSGASAGTINDKVYNGNKLLGYALDPSAKKQSVCFLKNIWQQICEVFNEKYDEHLIFEVLNEPRNVGGSDEWNPSKEKLAGYNALILAYEQACLDVIRASGKNNATRYVMVPPYAASPYCLEGFSLPSDSAYDRLLLSFHAYTPYEFCMWSSSKVDVDFDSNDKGAIDYGFDVVRKKFPDIGAVCGETSAENKNNLSQRVAWAKYFFGKAYKTYGIPVILWDNNVPTADSNHNGEHHGYFDRENLSWYFPEINQALLQLDYE